MKIQVNDAGRQADLRRAICLLLTCLLVGGLTIGSSRPVHANAAAILLNYTTFTDSINYVHVVGEVQNVGSDNIQFTKVYINEYDAAGNLLGTDFTYAEVEEIAPGGKSPIHDIFTPPAGFHHVTVDVPTAQIFPSAPNHYFTTKVTNTFTDSIGYNHIVGTVTNYNTTTARFVKTIFTFYDASGTTTNTDFTYVNTNSSSDIGPGQTASFEEMVSGTRPYSSYAVLTQSNTPASPGAVPASPPSAPTGVAAAAGNAKASVTWNPPASNGGAPITNYLVAVTPVITGSPVSVNGSQTSAAISGLANGTAYSFSVAAANSAGTGPSSASSAAVTPMAPKTFVGGGFTAVAPYRILDTRLNSSTLGAGRMINVPVAGAGGTSGVPASATGVVLNVTAVNPSAAGYLTVWPTGEPKPTASNLNFVPGAVVPNLVEAALGGGSVSIFNYAGTTDVIADVAGYTSASGDGYTPITPSRLLDTRLSGQTIGSGAHLTLTIADGTKVPSTATGAVLNVTVTNPTANSFLTVWPTGSTKPTASNLNFTPSQTIPNRVQVKLGQGGSVDIFNLAGSADVIVDLNGYFTPGSGAVFTGVTPTRYLDTRSTSQTLGGQGTLPLTVTGGDAAVPTTAKAVVLNVTVVAGNSGYLTAYPAGRAAPQASDLNFSAGQVVPNLVVVGVGSGGQIAFYNLAGPTDVIVDVLGWYS